MNTGIDKIEECVEHLPQTWETAFQVAQDEAEFSRMLRLLSVAEGDIFTLKLKRTVGIAGAIAEGRVQIIGHTTAKAVLHDMLRLMRLVAMHNRLARSGVTRICEPAFYVRTDTGLRPAFPLSHLSTMTGYERQTLVSLLAPLVQDGAIRMVLNNDGTEAVILNDGFVDDGGVRRFMRF